MRKLSIAILFSLCTVLATTDARAIGFHISYWEADDFETGIGAGIKHKFGLVPPISIDVRASYYRFNDSDLNLYPLEAAGRLKLGLFYGGLGVGYYIFTHKDVSASNSFGTFLIVGLEFAPMGLGAFAEAKWTFVDAEIGGVTGNADGYGINLGMLFSW